MSANLRVLEAETTAVLAQVYLARKDLETARRSALQAVRLAEGFDGRLLLCEAFATLAEAEQGLGLAETAADDYSKLVNTLNWIAANSSKELVEPYMHRPDVQALLKKTFATFEKSGRSIETVKEWIDFTGEQ